MRDHFFFRILAHKVPSHFTYVALAGRLPYLIKSNNYIIKVFLICKKLFRLEATPTNYFLCPSVLRIPPFLRFHPYSHWPLQFLLFSSTPFPFLLPYLPFSSSYHVKKKRWQFHIENYHNIDWTFLWQRDMDPYLFFSIGHELFYKKSWIRIQIRFVP